MASWMIHLRVAEKVLEQSSIPDEARFILGNMAPDSGVPTENGYVPEKAVSHVRCMDETGKVRIMPERYAAQYLPCEDARACSFHLGYWAHLLTDLAWNRVILPDAKGRFADLLAQDAAAFWRMVKRDWYDMDFLFLQAHPDFRAWQTYCAMEDMGNDYVDFFVKTAFADRRAWIMDFYREGAATVQEREMYLSWAALDAFVEDTAREIARTISNMIA